MQIANIESLKGYMQVYGEYLSKQRMAAGRRLHSKTYLSSV